MTLGHHSHRIMAAYLLLGFAALSTIACGGRQSKTKVPTPEEVYQIAIKKIEKKKYFSARKMLQDSLPRIPPEDRDLMPKVQMAIADAFYLDGGALNYGEALNSYRNFLTFFPAHEKADYAQFMVGMSLFRQVLAPDRDQTLTRRAISELRKVEALFPFSEYVADARRAIQEGHDELAEHERIVGFYYQRRGAWEAAINRYRDTLADYPTSDNTNRVLLDLAFCLLKIRNRIDAADLLERLDREDPEGKLSKRGRKLLASYDRRIAKEQRKLAK